MKKILFPFLDNNRHDFLLKKSWFRLIIVIYIIALIITPFFIWLDYVNYNGGWCYGALQNYEYSEFNEKLAECHKLARATWIPGAAFGIFGTLIIHYIIQLVFFKLIINYIVLGGKK